MRTRTIGLMATLACTVMLAACSQAPTPSLEVPDMPTASSTYASSSQTAPPGSAVPAPASSAPDVPSNPSGATPGASATPGGQKPFKAPTAPASDDPQAQMLDAAGIDVDRQVTSDVGPFSTAEVRQAYAALVGMLTSGAHSSHVTSPGPDGFTSDQQVKDQLTLALSLWMTPTGLDKAIAQTIALGRVPVDARTAAQQSYFAVLPAGACPDTASCTTSAPIEFTKPVVSPWTSPDGKPGVAIKVWHGYGLYTQTYDAAGNDTGPQPVRIGVNVTASLLPAGDGTWQVADISGANVGFQKDQP